jgi:alpha-ribazole phosphatase
MAANGSIHSKPRSNTKTTPIFLVRHLPPIVQAGLCYGQTDLLSDIISPCEQAHLLAQLPAKAAVFSSPLLRCATLAQALFADIAIQFNPLLKEINFGAWEMVPWNAIERAQLDAWAADNLYFAPPEGESFNDLCARVRLFVHNHLKRQEPAIIVTHAGVIKAFLYLFAGMDVSSVVGFVVPFGAVIRVEILLD